MSLPHSSRVSVRGHSPRSSTPLLFAGGVADPGGKLIWRTQIPALRLLCAHEPQGTSCSALKPIYFELARHYPEIYDGHTFHQWGQFMVDLDVFRVEAGRIHITRLGRTLLHTLAAEERPEFATLFRNE